MKIIDMFIEAIKNIPVRPTLRDFKIKTKIKVRNEDSYYFNQIGIIIKFQPYTLTHPPGLFQNGMYNPDQFLIRFKDKSEH